MTDWNEGKARDFIKTIANPITRRLTLLFLDELIVRYVYSQQKPEAGFDLQKPEGEFDLLFYVKIISRIVEQHELLRMVLDGKSIDEGWEGVADAFPPP